MSSPIFIRDSSSAARARILIGLFENNKRILAVFEDKGQSREVLNDISSFGFNEVVLFSGEPQDIAGALFFLRSGNDGIIITDADSLDVSVPHPEEFSQNIVFKKGLALSPGQIPLMLEKEGFKRENFVYERGFYALRGSVLDIWDFASEAPVRIRFGVADIEEINYIDVSTQMSVRPVLMCEIYGKPVGDGRLLDFLNADFVFLHPDSVEIKSALGAEYILTPSCSGGDTGFRRAPVYNGKIEYFLDDLKNYEENGFSITLFWASEESRDYLSGIIESKTNLRVSYRKARISGGVISQREKIAFLKSEEILGFGDKTDEETSAPQKKYPRGGLVYRKGDIIVHEEYGIASFVKLSRFSIRGKDIDYITLKYFDGVAHIPLEEFSKLHRYRAPHGIKPVLSRLATRDFSQKKKKVYDKVFKMAKHLLETASHRKLVRGISHKASEAEREFAGQFPYEETKDQREAIKRVLSDMEEPVPMEHLLCGDVGYGKTEVAMRAAFRACWGGYQVAYVVPTTVLAQQQFYVFKDRFKNFPIAIEMLSRFSAGGKKDIIRNVKNGKTDIVVATHSVFADAVNFARLGLLIIDEEHRFGVGQKELLKERYPSTDILMMSATPIPRTLSMALSRIMSFSIIETPPPGRISVDTFVGLFDEKLLKSAVRRELVRGGQIFYVYNRITAINTILEDFKKLFPEVRIAVAHARMSSEKLSKIMREFANGKYDVLLSTIIIQSGLDIPRVNTLIIRKTQLLGLAQMYQLRGRIGRGMKKAFCYFFYDRDITQTARKRFEFLQEFEDLSSGFRLAMRDMELRGSGNIFGFQQHGYIKDVGTELYFKLLERAVFNLKGYKPKVPCEIKFLSGGRFFPSEYISDSDERFRLLIRLSRVNSIEGLEEFRNEIVDRFGEYPEAVGNLFDSVKLKVMADKCGFSKIEETHNGFIIESDTETREYKGNLKSLITDIT
ncbi:MAG: hypothetical protein COT16_02715 [Elusimicrobia bacterium CG08_land_8_20_14_0_20_44_26]|nr:MAG: hypothetical protein COT16_02715 [Elusimicrobia bacterium CG08_land_8_20_14_0_20_44_26]